MIRVGKQNRVFILTGAGVSAESGIPTFRGAGGLWRNYRIEAVASPEAWARDPVLVWEFYSMRRKMAKAARPNAAHVALAELESKIGERLFLCTQNVDNLHEQAGSTHVTHMHGELLKTRCERCLREPFADDACYEPPVAIPRCECGGKLRPHICWFGEVPFKLDSIFAELERCALFVAIGTSGVVEPAASFVAQVRARARTYYVGPELPANHSAFEECFQGEAGKIVPDLFRLD